MWHFYGPQSHPYDFSATSLHYIHTYMYIVYIFVSHTWLHVVKEVVIMVLG